MKIKKNLAEAFIYLSAYLGGAVFALVGGVFFLTCKDEAIKKPLKNALLLFVVFLGAEAFALVSEDLFFAVDFLGISYWIDLIVDLGKIVVFGVTTFLAFSNNNQAYYELKGFWDEK